MCKIKLITTHMLHKKINIHMYRILWHIYESPVNRVYSKTCKNQRQDVYFQGENIL